MPNLPQPDGQLRQAALAGRLVVFVGAGASALCGSPTWENFSAAVIQHIYKTGHLSFIQYEQLLAISDYRRALSIAKGIAKEKGIAIDYASILRPHDQEEAGERLYRALNKLNPVFVTTNYDAWLDQEPFAPVQNPPLDDATHPDTHRRGRRIFYDRRAFHPGLLLNRGDVIHLHGSVNDPESMVISLREYINHYSNANVKSFLDTLFRDYVVLFIGYGLGELELLEYILKHNQSAGPKEEPRHFILYPHRSTEQEQTNFLITLFRNEYGINAIPFSIDAKGWSTLADVLEAWLPQIEVREKTIVNLQRELDKFATDPSPDACEAALSVIQSHPDLLPYLFTQLTQETWFETLDAKSFFAPSHNPPLIATEEDGKKLYQAPQWPALIYLKNIAAKASQKTASRIVEIATAITKDSEIRKIENWVTNWTLASAISKLPLAIITRDLLELTQQWTKGRFDIDLIGRELGLNLLPRLLDSDASDDRDKSLFLLDVLCRIHTEGNGE